MLQTILLIPDKIAGIPVFGLGWALGVWAVICVAWLALLARLPEKKKELASAFPLMLIVAAMIVWVAPHIEVTIHGERGLPIRGYGVMMLLAIVAGVGLAAYRAKRMGIDPEQIFNLALAMCFAGVVGARAFYVIQKWDQFQGDLAKIFSFTEGGLVVFGSAIGAIAALVGYCLYRKLPTLAIADIVAPSMMVGLAIGRIGCLLNGCCYGGYCELPIAIRFPPEAPVYMDQLFSGMLYGIEFAEETDPKTKKTHVIAKHVIPGSVAAQSGVQDGEAIEFIEGYRIDNLKDVHFVIGQIEERRQLNPDRSFRIQINQHEKMDLDKLPARSQSVHPTQIYSSIDALLLAAVLWFFYPFRRRDGEVLALMLTLHPISRFVLEIVRTDEAGALGTPFTISQLVGFGFLAAAIALWCYIETRRRPLALPA
jgi:phosphatidylglycerol:prolipoprotein diacylglycerol transferase